MLRYSATTWMREPDAISCEHFAVLKDTQQQRYSTTALSCLTSVVPYFPRRGNGTYIRCRRLHSCT